MSYSNKTHVVLIAREDPETKIRKFSVCTEEVFSVKLDEPSNTVFVHFRRQSKEAKPYQYPTEDVVVLKNPEVLNPDEFDFYYQGERQDNVYVACHFMQEGFDYWTISYKDHRHDLVCLGTDISLSRKERSLNRTDSFDYLEKMAYFHGYYLRVNDRVILGDHYQRIRDCKNTPLLDAYLSPLGFEVNKKESAGVPIFPFGINGSQLKAVKAALDNRISIIQGPPGTGKTKTILNLLANLVIRGKNMLAVAGSNSATDNILEKMQKVTIPDALGGGEIDLSFIIAKLGNSSNKNRFIKGQDEGFALSGNFVGAGFDEDSALDEIAVLLRKLTPLFEEDILLHRKMQDVRDFMLDSTERPKQLDAEVETLKQSLVKKGFAAAKERLQLLSMQVFLYRLQKRYGPGHRRPAFNPQDLEDGSVRSSEFLAEYPVVLSTAYSSKKSLDKDVLYDYLIVDEASQVDVSTGALALSCAKNAVIVGDVKQLPNVIKEEERRVSEAIFEFYRLPEYYNYASHNFLQSVSAAFSGLPETELLEHYRCHPKIIGFCNKMFYDNKLVVMTEDHGEEDVLSLVQTVPGYHFYDFRNHREEAEIAAFRDNLPYGENDIAIITPYRHQVNELDDEEYLEEDFAIGTIHKFQGREVPAVIISTVVNSYDSFVNNPNLINVAVSRAQSQLVLVTNGNYNNSGTVQDLVEYIRRQHGRCVEGKVRSWFDLLFPDYYGGEYEEFIRAHKLIPTREETSPAEEIIYGVICDVLRDYPDLKVEYECRLSELCGDIVDPENDEEYKYVQDPRAHVDFLIRRSHNGAPVLAIEVDGLSYHVPGSFHEGRDDVKDALFERKGLRLVRLTTKFSENEDDVIREELELALQATES